MTSTQLGVVGSPIAHSKSPILHAAAYRVLHLDWEYARYEVPAGQLSHFVSGCDSRWRGLSVTMPLKREAWQLAQNHDDAAQSTGAVNTLVFAPDEQGRTVSGYNTDVFGMASALTAAGAGEIGHAVIIGGGATAESSLVALRDLGVARTSVGLRDTSRAGQLVALAARLKMPLTVVALSDVSTLPEAEVCVSTVPGSAQVGLESLARCDNAILLDAAYDVWPSPRALEWRERGGVTVSGLSMLAFQALKQVKLFLLDDGDAQLPDETAVMQAMFASVGLNELGL